MYYNTLLHKKAIDDIYINMDKISQKLGNNIKRIRKMKSMSQGDIFRATGMDRAYISRLENGYVNPTVSVLNKIAKSLGVTPDELLK